MNRIFASLIIFLLAACAPTVMPLAPRTASQNTSPQAFTETNPEPGDGLCAFMEARQPLPEISAQLLNKLQSAGLPAAEARAQAYGENCIAEDGSLVRFAARETDFYVTLLVIDLQDLPTLGKFIEQTLALIEEFPVDTTPGPNPGYIGLDFKSSQNTQKLWFSQSSANDLLAQGLRGEELYNALSQTP